MPRMRILLIDDDALLTRSYVRMLAGAEVVVCRAAAEARAALEHALALAEAKGHALAAEQARGELAAV